MIRIDIRYSIACIGHLANATIVLSLAERDDYCVMSSKQTVIPLSPTVTRVLDEFVGAMKCDNEIENDAIDRLDNLLRVGSVPKPDEIFGKLFPPRKGGEK